MKMDRYNKRINRTNGFLKFIAVVLSVVAVVGTVYMFCFHEDSAVQDWVQSVKEQFEENIDK